MESSNINIEKKYIITYNNHLNFDGKLCAFRKKELFILDGVPKHVKRSLQGWWFGKKLLTLSKAQELIKSDPVHVDVTDLQWYQQCQLDEVFNL